MADPVRLKCFLDGNSLCIIGEHFVDIQESNVMFVGLNGLQLRAYKELAEKEGLQCGKPIRQDVRLFVTEKVDRDIEKLEKEQETLSEEINILLKETDQLRDKLREASMNMTSLRRAKTWFDTHPDG